MVSIAELSRQKALLEKLYHWLDMDKKYADRDELVRIARLLNTACENWWTRQEPIIDSLIIYFKFNEIELNENNPLETVLNRYDRSLR